MSVTAQSIDEAAERLAGVVIQSPLQYNERLSAATGAKVWLKREDLQPVRSYKLRGAYNLIAQLSAAERTAGVVCASAGNHGQGVAYACARLGIKAQIFVPSTTPRQKRQRMRQLGEGWAELIVRGDTYDEAAALAQEVAAEQGFTLVPAFDDERTIAGQGTVAAEIVAQLGRAPDTLIVPVGGGGMIAGCLTWLAERHPGTKVVGAEPSGAASMSIALEAGRPRDLPKLDTFVDGAAVRRVGELTFAIAQRFKPHMFSVPEGRICSEMLALYQSDGVIAEPAGALASAALGVYRPSAARVVVAVVSGGNNDLSRYAEIEERALVYEGRKHYFLVNFPQEPGALRRFLDEVLGPDDDITLFEYVKRSNRETGPALVGIELGEPEGLGVLLDNLNRSRLTVERVLPDSPFYRFLV
ncbi:threonine ammonia-lyase IlvA [Micropruina glycogenica]|uniref:L-threonine dehydratase n=1 Tax=Micropruina glycogenica TaxID=75385 RepID=A0A2N9JJ97_9ACTN|nr:threonine ammonia-lyase IlvA [Micropruina glycogenica]SPD87621.1 L-threonine dehydratase biosynthetic IlvA [Micropruina glycogenica]